MNLECNDYKTYSISTLQISDEMQKSKEIMPTKEKVKQVVFSLDGNSSAEPDGYSACFYQHCWEIIKWDLLAAMEDFFSGSK